jgi:hypothetical protein
MIKVPDRPSQPPEIRVTRATFAFTARCNLVCCAHSFRVCLSEGFAVLLSRHGASPATGSESFNPGRSLTDLTMCPCLDTNLPALEVDLKKLTRGTCQIRAQQEGRLTIV